MKWDVKKSRCGGGRVCHIQPLIPC